MITFKDYPKWSHLRQEDAKRWIEEVAVSYGAVVKRLSYSFVNDERILEINRTYLNHNYTTDIISFGYAEGEVIKGEIYISTDTVSENARRFGVSSTEELDRVMIHGLLHFLGYSDHTYEEKEEMRKEEDNCLLLRPKNLKDK